MLLRIPGTGNVPIPFHNTVDTGKYAKALTKVSPGKNLLCFSDMLTFPEYVALWSKTRGVPAAFELTTIDVHAKLSPAGYGEEIGEMFAYMVEFGYWGKDPSTIYPKDVSSSLAITLFASITLFTSTTKLTRYSSGSRLSSQVLRSTSRVQIGQSFSVDLFQVLECSLGRDA